MRYNDSNASEAVPIAEVRRLVRLLKEKEGLGMKGFSVCGLVLGISAAVCGICAVVFSFLGLSRRG